MLWTIAVILFIMWALGLVTSYTMSGFIHILLVLAIVGPNRFRATDRSPLPHRVPEVCDPL